uniref:Uncharacterized protein n=1 Tax=Meloidogyne incognita TaxID=6306 RepID=A0A914L4I5_MELIC
MLANCFGHPPSSKRRGSFGSLSAFFALPSFPSAAAFAFGSTLVFGSDLGLASALVLVSVLGFASDLGLASVLVLVSVLGFDSALGFASDLVFVSAAVSEVGPFPLTSTFPGLKASIFMSRILASSYKIKHLISYITPQQKIINLHRHAAKAISLSRARRPCRTNFQRRPLGRVPCVCDQSSRRIWLSLGNRCCLRVDA